MRIQILPRSSGSNKDFYKISVGLFIVVYLFLWMSKPECQETSYQPRSVVLMNDTTGITRKEYLHTIANKVHEENKKAEFIRNWCRERQARLDWKAVLSSCENKMAWNSSRNKEHSTDPATSFISLWDIRRVGEYSRFSIQSQTKEGKLKMEGGDSWRVLIRGPSSISPTVFDHGNGTYEVLFLVMEAGVYSLNITLDFTLCDGFKDPPVDWFIIGEFSTGRTPKIRPLDCREKLIPIPRVQVHYKTARRFG